MMTDGSKLKKSPAGGDRVHSSGTSAALAEMLEKSGPNPSRREAARTTVYRAAILVGKHSQTPITIRNLSSTGALIQSRTKLENETLVSLARGSLRANGSLVWREGQLGGIKFAEPINLAVWNPGATYAGQSQVDREVAKSRDRVSPLAAVPDTGPPTQSVENLAERIAEELAFVSRKLEGLGKKLSDDPSVVVGHATQLQDLDISSQVLGHLARLLNSSEPNALLAAIGMDDLRRRLMRTNLY